MCSEQNVVKYAKITQSRQVYSTREQSNVMASGTGLVSGHPVRQGFNMVSELVGV